MEKLRAKVNEADTTIRKLMIRNSVLEKEKSRFSTESDLYQTEETERENLLQELDGHRQAAFDLNGKIIQLNHENSTLDEKIRSLIRVKEENEHLQQKCVSQMATLQNMKQVIHFLEQLYIYVHFRICIYLIGPPIVILRYTLRHYNRPLYKRCCSRSISNDYEPLKQRNL